MAATTARTIQAARFAGLELAGQTGKGAPILRGTPEEWEVFDRVTQDY